MQKTGGLIGFFIHVLEVTDACLDACQMHKKNNSMLDVKINTILQISVVI